jgi:hypothetical protein
MRRGRGRARGAMMARRMARRMVARMRMRRRRRRRRRMILVGGLIALGAYKLSKRDVQRVEEHTGKSAEELSDEELDKAMGDLNISKEEMSDEEWDYAEQEDSEDDYLDELERLSELNKQGILTDEEFEAKKKQLLGL